MATFYLYITLIIPGMMILVGLCLLKYPPKDINAFYGYRTNRSKKNKDTWLFAQKHYGRNSIRINIMMLFISLILFCFSYRWNDLDVLIIWIVSIQTVVILLTIIPTEIALKRTFDVEGRRRKDEEKKGKIY